MPTVKIEEMDSYIGKETGVSSWHEVTQDQVNMFADDTYLNVLEDVKTMFA